MREPVRAALREGTQRTHRRLEERLALDGEGLTTARYRDLLIRLLGCYRPLEARLRVVATTAPALGAWAGTVRSTWLEQDLRGLGVDPAGVPDAPVAALPPLRTAAGALGCLYVVEGSALGGRVIAGRVQQRGGEPPLPTRFFVGFGARTGPRWLRFRQQLASWGGDPAAVAEMVRTAERTFMMFEGALCAPSSECGPEVGDAAPTTGAGHHRGALA